MKVEIDGVLYVPVSEASPDAARIIEALALTYHTPETLAEFGWADLCVVVDEGQGGTPLDEFVAALLADKH